MSCALLLLDSLDKTSLSGLVPPACLWSPPVNVSIFTGGGHLSAYHTVTEWPQNVSSTAWTSCWRGEHPNRCNGWSSIQPPTTKSKLAADRGKNGSRRCYLVLQQNFSNQTFLEQKWIRQLHSWDWPLSPKAC